ncbi:MAG: DUF1365 domain-containing protein [Pseudomonadota bacterium]
MEVSPQILTAKIMHKRLFPKVHGFAYALYYLALPLPATKLPSRLLSFHPKDVGFRDGTDPSIWARTILKDYGLDKAVQHIVLITMPRVLGYVFNPVSFYLCLDIQKSLIATICEVHNTFGEQHTYVCAHKNHSELSPDMWLEATKVFHVSPFLPRNGQYRFRFDLRDDTLGIWINYYDDSGKKQLITFLAGSFSPLTSKTLRLAFWSHPLVTLRAITLIHWQALKLVWKRIRHVPKPLQIVEKVTATRDLTKM